MATANDNAIANEVQSGGGALNSVSITLGPDGQLQFVTADGVPWPTMDQATAHANQLGGGASGGAGPTVGIPTSHLPSAMATVPDVVPSLSAAVPPVSAHSSIPSWLLALAGPAASALSGAFAPSPFQERHSYSGTAADPVSVATDTRGLLNDSTKAIFDWLDSPIDLSGSVPQTPRGYSGGGLPFPIELSSRPQGDPARLKFEGFNLGTPTLGGPNGNVPATALAARNSGGNNNSAVLGGRLAYTTRRVPLTQPASPAASGSASQAAAAAQLLLHVAKAGSGQVSA